MARVPTHNELTIKNQKGVHKAPFSSQQIVAKVSHQH